MAIFSEKCISLYRSGLSVVMTSYIASDSGIITTQALEEGVFLTSEVR